MYYYVLCCTVIKLEQQYSQKRVKKEKYAFKICSHRRILNKYWKMSQKKIITTKHQENAYNEWIGCIYLDTIDVVGGMVEEKTAEEYQDWCIRL